ncbi:disulfide bond formation protein DsbA [Bordetella genomosp. 5]|uniref:DsbA family oxidoreductase n=1 Tax=Bordetella genomosp. 5 TaxID=1395608 RepID=UPI000B9EDE9A|nr:DsbA family oxidoreductase [Bordetella genomosp. 5]OZI44781.1 disulfide bond formation protein DsbA [Bordetella genomosp. 5]
MPIDISITSDFICPWCFIGERRLARALALLPADTLVTLRWQPFELNPDMPAAGVEREAYRAQKFGSLAQSRLRDAQTIDAARDDNIAFNYDAMRKTPNTFLAHRLLWLAQREGLATPMARTLFAAYFEQGLDIGDPATLAGLGARAGLPREEVAAFLQGDEGKDEVRAIEREGLARGIRGVPFFDIGGEIVSGAQPVETFALALQRAHERSLHPTA